MFLKKFLCCLIVFLIYFFNLLGFSYYCFLFHEKKQNVNIRGVIFEKRVKLSKTFDHKFLEVWT